MAWLLAAILAVAGASAKIAAAASAAAAAPTDAEIVDWDVRVIDSVIPQGFSREIQQDMRVQVLTQAGAQAQAQGSIPYDARMTVEDVRIRCTDPGGRTRTISIDKMYDAIVFQSGNHVLKARAYAIPGVVPGSVIEYWLRARYVDPASVSDLWFPCQLDLPVRHLRIRVRPWGEATFVVRWNNTYGRVESLGTAGGGLKTYEVRDLPAFRVEPLMPGPEESRLTLVGHYRDRTVSDAASAWSRVTATFVPEFDRATKPTSKLTELAGRLAGDSQDPEEIANRIFRFCRRSSADTTTATKRSGTPPVLDQGDWGNLAPQLLDSDSASALSITRLFAALARAAGLTVVPVLRLPAGHAAFDSEMVTANRFTKLLVAVSGRGGWRYYDPGTPGSLPGWPWWEDQGQPALLAFPMSPRVARLPMPPLENSRTLRRARLRMSGDGSLRGDIRVEFHGEAAMRQWSRDGQGRLDQQIDLIRKRVLDTFPGAELDSLSVAAYDDSVGRYGWQYWIHVPDYARVAGRDLLFSPFFFEVGSRSPFVQSGRWSPVRFAAPVLEIDSVHVELDPGLTVAARDSLGRIDIAGIGACTAEWRAAGRTVDSCRRFELGRGGRLEVPAEGYAPLKAAFDRVQEIGTTLVLAERGAEQQKQPLEGD